MATDVQCNSLIRWTEKLIALSFVQDVVQDQAKVIERSNIHESDLPNIDQENLLGSKKEVLKDICIIQRVPDHDAEFLIPETFL